MRHRPYTPVKKMRRLKILSATRLFSVTIYAAIALISFALAIFFLSLRFRYELLHGYSWDSTLYLTVGRGITNGYLPYQDLFENKPPGIFLLSALFFLFFDDLSWTAWVQIGVLMITFIVIVGFGILLAQDRKIPAEMRLLLLGNGVLFATFLTLFSAVRSGLYQVESFGAAFGVCYVALAAMPTRRLWPVLLAGIALLFSIGFKEPFALSCAAGGLLLVHTRRELLRVIVAPFIIAAIAGVITALLLGYLVPYTTIYLPFMFGHFVRDAGPLWLRGLNMSPLLRDFWDFSPASILVFLLMIPGAMYRALDYRIIAVGWLVRSGILLLAIYIASMAVATGISYYGHHFAFMLPLLAAFFFSFALMLRRFARSMWAQTLAVLTAGLLTVAIWQAPREDGLGLTDLKNEATQAAEQIDLVLNRCGEKRYLFLGPNGIKPFGLTTHIPLGPLFFQYSYLLDERQIFFRDSFQKSIETAPLVIMDPDIEVNTLREKVDNVLANEFTREPWPCAGTINPPFRYTFYYRKAKL